MTDDVEGRNRPNKIQSEKAPLRAGGGGERPEGDLGSPARNRRQDEKATSTPLWNSRLSPKTRKGVLGEVLIIFGIAILACSILWQLRSAHSFLANNFQAFIAAVFLYLPTGLLIKRKEDFDVYGLTHRPLRRGLLVFLITTLVVFPLFAAGFYLYYQSICGISIAMPRQIKNLCRRYVGHWRNARLKLPKGFWQVVAAQIIVVALPEEYFFRGYIQSRLEVVWPSRKKIFGGAVGPSLIVASLLFAIGHLLVDFNALRLAVFFPALVFGWMRQATGSILAGLLFHAASNLVSDVLHRSFF